MGRGGQNGPQGSYTSNKQSELNAKNRPQGIQWIDPIIESKKDIRKNLNSKHNKGPANIPSIWAMLNAPKNNVENV